MPSTMGTTTKQPKLRASCDACNQAKVKCSKLRPQCARCENNSLQCVYSVSLRAGKKRAVRTESTDRPPRSLPAFPRTISQTPVDCHAPAQLVQSFDDSTGTTPLLVQYQDLNIISDNSNQGVLRFDQDYHGSKIFPRGHLTTSSDRRGTSYSSQSSSIFDGASDLSRSSSALEITQPKSSTIEQLSDQGFWDTENPETVLPISPNHDRSNAVHGTFRSTSSTPHIATSLMESVSLDGNLYSTYVSPELHTMSSTRSPTTGSRSTHPQCPRRIPFLAKPPTPTCSCHSSLLLELSTLYTLTLSNNIDFDAVLAHNKSAVCKCRTILQCRCMGRDDAAAITLAAFFAKLIEMYISLCNTAIESPSSSTHETDLIYSHSSSHAQTTNLLPSAVSSVTENFDIRHNPFSTNDLILPLQIPTYHPSSSAKRLPRLETIISELQAVSKLLDQSRENLYARFNTDTEDPESLRGLDHETWEKLLDFLDGRVRRALGGVRDAVRHLEGLGM